MVSERLKKLAEKEKLTEDEVRDLTLEECHRVLWWNLHLTGEKKKDAVPILDVRFSCSDCYACDHDQLVERNHYRMSDSPYVGCSRCPIDWPMGDCQAYASPYEKWCRAKTTKARKKYARIIAEMEWREKC